MGWFDRLFGGVTKATGGRVVAPSVARALPYFAIIDVETTGLSPDKDRVIELAVVRVDRRGKVIDEWASRFNPEVPVGATYIHGITESDVTGAPLFRDVASGIVPRIAGLPIAAHNARFDLAFLRAEFRRAGWDIPWLPAYCTLDGSHHYLPNLARRRLVDCCWTARVPLNDAHSALGDARATAGLLNFYMQDRSRPQAELLSAPGEARRVVWPAGPTRAPETSPREDVGAGRVRPVRFTSPRPAQPALIAQLTKLSLVEVLDEGAPVGALTYVETLLDALEDGVISDEEAGALADLSAVYELTATDVAATHNALMLALAHKALDDGHLSRDERDQLNAIAGALRLPDSLVPALIAQADAARSARLEAGLSPLPADWTLGEPLRVGDKVVFTGFEGRERERARLEQRTQSLGVRVLGNVSGLTAMLVTDGSFAGGKLARAKELGTRIVSPETYAILLQHLQPAATTNAARQKATNAVPRTVDVRTTVPAAALSTSPGEIRAWGLANGHEVGVRGRLSTELIQAYALAVAGGQDPAGR